MLDNVYHLANEDFFRVEANTEEKKVFQQIKIQDEISFKPDSYSCKSYLKSGMDFLSP